MERLPEKKRGKKRALPSEIPLPLVPALLIGAAAKKKAPLPKLPKLKCALCPLGHSIEFPLVSTDIPNVYAHAECGSFVFETWVEDVQAATVADKNKASSSKSTANAPSSTTTQKVCGIDQIPRDRWNLVSEYACNAPLISDYFRNALFVNILPM